MRLNISINVSDNPLELPIAYHHILQSVFYDLMKDDSGSTALHEQGVDYGKRSFKLFTFGPLLGKYRINGSKITFMEHVNVEFRGLDRELVSHMAENAKTRGIRFGTYIYTDAEVMIYDDSKDIEAEEIEIEMISPICAYRTDESGHTFYFNTAEDDFYYAVADNFKRKYAATYGATPESTIQLFPHRVGPKDKYLTKYKGFYIEAYMGRYILKGKSEYLRFLYETGLGSKNSQGFGMFSVINMN